MTLYGFIAACVLISARNGWIDAAIRSLLLDKKEHTR